MNKEICYLKLTSGEDVVANILSRPIDKTSFSRLWPYDKVLDFYHENKTQFVGWGTDMFLNDGWFYVVESPFILYFYEGEVYASPWALFAKTADPKIVNKHIMLHEHVSVVTEANEFLLNLYPNWVRREENNFGLREKIVNEIDVKSKEIDKPIDGTVVLDKPGRIH